MKDAFQNLRRWLLKRSSHPLGFTPSKSQNSIFRCLFKAGRPIIEIQDLLIVEHPCVPSHVALRQKFTGAGFSGSWTPCCPFRLLHPLSLMVRSRCLLLSSGHLCSFFVYKRTPSAGAPSAETTITRCCVVFCKIKVRQQCNATHVLSTTTIF